MRPTPPAPTVLLLDAMGTLVHLDSPAIALREELAARFGVVVTEAQASAALRAEIDYYRAHMHEGATDAALAGLHQRCAEVLGAALPGSEALAGVGAAQLVDALLGALRFVAFPDAAPALERAVRAGRRVFVVSNWDCSLAAVLARVGLARWLDGVITSAQVGAAKPAPAIFAHALQLAGCAAGEALHVGDSVREDVAGARAAGVPALLLARDGRPSASGVRMIRSLDELGRP